ncbi:MAG: peptidoglycan-binding protein [Firmicutes bacterium]|nr:peptidoglycan-binding protein [Bacillota bacterium]
MNKQTKKKARIALLVALCVACFGMGICVPLAFQKVNVAADSTEKQKFEAIYNLLVKDWYFKDEVEDLETTLLEKAIVGMTHLEQDPHTNYFNLEQAQSYSSSLAGSSVGVGFSYYLNKNNNFAVKQVFVGSAAEQAGLQYRDEIIQVGDLVCSQVDSSEVVKLIKSSEGKELEIKYIRDGQELKTKVVPAIYDQTVVCEIMDDYAIVTVSSFSEDTGKDFAVALGRLQDAGIKKLIIDLRGNTGGYLVAAVDIASSLVKKGSVVISDETIAGEKTEYKTNDKYAQVKLDQIVVLQNGNTASASEALIGTLKDLEGKKLTTVGTNTYGKGTEQTSIAFVDGTSMKYTVAKWFTPNGTNINDVGWAPDVEVEQELAKRVGYLDMQEDEVITPDSVHTNAAAIQVYLQYLGYDVDRTDEYFSQQGSQALAAFQSDNGLESTGNCDIATWEALKSATLVRIGDNGKEGDIQLQSAISALK